MPQRITLEVAHATTNRIRRVADRAGLGIAATIARLLDELAGRREPELSLLLMEDTDATQSR